MYFLDFLYTLFSTEPQTELYFITYVIVIVLNDIISQRPGTGYLLYGIFYVFGIDLFPHFLFRF